MPDSTVVPAEVRELVGELTELRPMRRGSVSERYIKCGKPGCRCSQEPEARHGPYYSLTRAVKGRTRSRYLSAEEAQIVRRQIEAGRRFRHQLQQYWEAVERWADMDLAASETVSEEAEKGGSRKRSGQRRPGNWRS